jgi:hypothetical protein
VATPADILPQVLAETALKRIFAEEDFSPYAIPAGTKSINKPCRFSLSSV